VKKQRLSPEELRLWLNQLGDVKPLSKTKKLPEVSDARAPQPQDRVVERPMRQPKANDISEPFQRRELRRLQIEAELDLHGMSLNQGYEALERFLHHCQNNYLRVVLVITGKGSLSDDNTTMRGELPRWLKETPLRHLVTAYSHPAKPNHGGAGATYVRVRKKKVDLR